MLSFWIALPIFFISLPIDYFDSGLSLCPSKRLLNIECLGCGTTRGVMRAIHLDFQGAWRFNKISLFVTLILLILWLHFLGRIINLKIFYFLKKWY